MALGREVVDVMDAATRDLLDYSNGSYSTSDVGCRGDVIAIAPRIYPVPDFVREFTDWQQALVEATDTCALQNGVCWVLKPNQLAPRYGQPAYGSCPSCRTPSSSLAGVTPLAVASPDGVTLLPTGDGAVPAIWQRNPVRGPPERLVMAPSSMLYRGAVRAAQLISQRLGRPQVINAVRNGRVIPMTYVDPGGLVRTTPAARGYETNVYAMDPFEVRQAYAASRGASILPWGM